MATQKYKIPLFKLNFDETEEQALVSTIRSKWISIGPKCSEFESLFADKLSSKFALSLSNCTSALHLALKALELKENDEVIVPSLTFVATVNAIKYVNAKPVFCDVNSYDDLTLDPLHIKSLITKKTKAIVVMHYAGYPCDMDKIVNLAQNNNISIIEDACHAPLSEYKGKKLGAIGDIGCLVSFQIKILVLARAVC